MKTLITSDLNDFSTAATIINKGGLVAVPTETVYGLAANALDENAVSGIFKAKGRPSDNPLIVHIASLDMLRPLVKDIPHNAKILMDAFWPGPLTLIFNATDIIPNTVRAGLKTIAIRFPDHAAIVGLIKEANVPVAAPSANTSGKPSPTNAKRVIDDLSGKIDLIIDGGDCSVGLESTVVDVTGNIPIILRPGGITKAMLEDVLGKVLVDPALSSPSEVAQPLSPGMKYTHYSPDAKVIIVKGDKERIAQKINRATKKDIASGTSVGILATDETAHLFNKEAFILSAGSENDLSQIASNLFEILRRFDDNKIDIVYAVAFPNEDLGNAIMNRLEKSAGYNIIHA